MMKQIFRSTKKASNILEDDDWDNDLPVVRNKGTASSNGDIVMAKIKELQRVPGLYDFVLANCFLAGGAVRDTIRQQKPKDWDIFFKTEAAKNEFVSRFSDGMDQTGFGNLNYYDFQFITLDTGTPEKVIGNFDWDVNQVYFDFATNRLGGNVSSNNYLRLNTEARTPLSAIMRLPHLLSKGFLIEQKELLFAYTFVSLKVNLASPTAVQAQNSFISNGGFPLSGVTETTERAVKAALKSSPLMKALE